MASEVFVIFEDAMFVSRRSAVVDDGSEAGFEKGAGYSTRPPLHAWNDAELGRAAHECAPTGEYYESSGEQDVREKYGFHYKCFSIRGQVPIDYSPAMLPKRLLLPVAIHFVCGCS